LWIYKGLMLAWALWLASALLGWLRAGFASFRKGGVWRAKPPRSPQPARTQGVPAPFASPLVAPAPAPDAEEPPAGT
jgi:hypothetical protein